MITTLNMTMMKKWSAGLGILLVLLLAFNACKKDKQQDVKLEPKITSYYPNSGKGGTLVTIEGENFDGSLGSYTATIGGKNADMVSATGKAVVVRMPADGATGKLTLKLNDKSYDVGTYTYQDLSVTNVSPANGPAGAQIRISGAGFSSVKNPASVLINNKIALVVSVSDTLIVAEVPADAGYGPVTIKVDGKEASGRNFTYQAISAMKPLTGGANTRVVITGVGFETVAANNKVDFNGNPATVVEGTGTQLTVAAPAGVTTGPLSITINGQKITGQAFTVVSNPVITTVSPLSGPKGAQMTITGDIFSTVLDENKVFINNVEVPVQSATKTELKLTLPGGTGSGIVKVVVNDQATTGPAFKDQNLGISSLTPDNGLAGSTITINGTGFSTTAANNKVYFNGQLATVKTATATALTLNAPDGVTTGTVKVVVDGLEASSPLPFKRAGVMTFSNAIGSFASAIALDSHENVYVSNPADGKVKKISPAGVVSNLQANGADITFSNPQGLVFDAQDNIYVADQGASQIIKVTATGQKSVYASGFQPSILSFDNAGNLYVGLLGSAGMRKVAPNGTSVAVSGPSWVGTRMAFDATGNIYYSDKNLDASNGVEQISAGLRPTVIVGGTYDDAGYADGVGRGARFYGIYSMWLTQPNELTLIETYNRAIRTINISGKSSSTIAKFGSGYTDGTLVNATFSNMVDFAIAKDGSMYILDAGNNAVRKVFLK